MHSNLNVYIIVRSQVFIRKISEKKDNVKKILDHHYNKYKKLEEESLTRYVDTFF